MISERFTVLELTDLALRVPEIGAVNFNILHTVLTSVILELGLDGLKPPCHIQDETLAQVAITKARLERTGDARKPSKILTIKEMKDRKKVMDDNVADEEETGPEVLAEPDESAVSEVLADLLDEVLRLEEAPEVQDAEGSDAKEAKMTEDTETEKEDPIQDQGSQLEDIDKDVTGQTQAAAEDTDESVPVETETTVQEAEKTEESVPVQTQAEVEDEDEIEEGPVDRMSVDELQEMAQEVMEQSADIIAEKMATVTDALKILAEDELLDSDPAKVMEEMWRATNINRRMEAAEAGLRELSAILDVLLDKVEDIEDQTEDVLSKSKAMLNDINKFLERIRILEEMIKVLSLRIDESNEQRISEVERLESILNELMKYHEETKIALEILESNHRDLAERVVYKEELEKAKLQMSEDLETKMKEMMKVLREVEDTLVKKEDFMELTSRVEEIEETKVSREELGRLLEPGFIDSFLNEQESLRTELEELKTTVVVLGENLEALNTRIDEEILRTMESNFADLKAMLEPINKKLALLDPDEINDSFASLEEQASIIVKEVGEMKSVAEQFRKEAKINFNKISNVNESLNRMDHTKADKSKMYELLEMKADVDLLMNKLDRSEFVAVVGDMKENLERLAITVKINEEEMNHNFMSVRHELTLKMYTEDFITATEPMRNRIKALMYELQRVKQIALTHLFPDAPGVVKCISCKRGAHLAGPKYLGDADIELLQEVSTGANAKLASSSSSKYQSGTASSREASDVKLPPIDLDSLPIPPLDKPRERDALRLPVLFATARPQIGLAHEKRRKAIDEKLVAYFATKPVRPCAGEYTRTYPQQRGVAFTTVMLSQAGKEEVLLDGIDQKIYKGALYEGHAEREDSTPPEKQEETGTKDEEVTKEKPVIPSLKEPRTKKGFIKPEIRPPSRKSGSRSSVSPSIVSLHVDDEPLQKTSPLTQSSPNMTLPSNRVKNIEKPL